MPSQPAEFARPDAGKDAQHDDDRSYDQSPKLHLQHIDVEGRLRGRADRGKHQEQGDISANTMVLVHRLRIVHSTIEAWRKVLCNPNNRLQSHQNICHQAQYRMGRLEMSAIVIKLVVFNDDEPCDGSEYCHIVQSSVCVGSLLLLLRGVCGLQDEDALDEEENGGGVEKLCY